MVARQTTAHFIARARAVHGDKFDYSESKYIESGTHLTIICPVHGRFTQSPDAHYAKGCKQCGVDRRVAARTGTTNQFIERAVAVHGDRFDYSKVDYRHSEKPVTIICRLPGHGEFPQTPRCHLNGKGGCPECARELCRVAHQHDLDTFIQMSRDTHGDRYDYSKVVYVDSKTPVIIICPDHGDFEQVPNCHTQGQGCRACANARKNEGRAAEARTNFVTEARRVHGEAYDYDMDSYTQVKDKMTIRCRVPGHGEFRQTPGNHLSGAGCPLCNRSRGEVAVENWLINLAIPYEREHYYPINLPGKKRLRYLRADFFLPSYNIFIEYDGAHHFYPVRMSRRGTATEAEKAQAQERFELVQYRDGLKNEWARENGVPLLRIPYWEDVDAYLSEHLLPLLRARADAVLQSVLHGKMRARRRGRRFRIMRPVPPQYAQAAE